MARPRDYRFRIRATKEGRKRADPHAAYAHDLSGAVYVTDGLFTFWNGPDATGRHPIRHVLLTDTATGRQWRFTPAQWATGARPDLA